VIDDDVENTKEIPLKAKVVGDCLMEGEITVSLKSLTRVKVPHRSRSDCYVSRNCRNEQHCSPLTPICDNEYL
jgi:hypothetical protein